MFLPSYFSIFLCVMQKTLKPSKRMFLFPGWMRKNFIPWNFSWRVLVETWDASKKGLLKKQHSVPNTCNISPLEKIFFQNLDAFFKYLWSILSQLFQKYSLYWYYPILINFKITWPPKHYSPPTKITISVPLPLPKQISIFYMVNKTLQFSKWGNPHSHKNIFQTFYSLETNNWNKYLSWFWSGESKRCRNDMVSFKLERFG